MAFRGQTRPVCWFSHFWSTGLRADLPSYIIFDILDILNYLSSLSNLWLSYKKKKKKHQTCDAAFKNFQFLQKSQSTLNTLTKIKIAFLRCSFFWCSAFCNATPSLPVLSCAFFSVLCFRFSFFLFFCINVIIFFISFFVQPLLLYSVCRLVEFYVLVYLLYLQIV